MSLQIKNIDSQEQWDNFIEEKKPKTFLHTWEWGEFNESKKNKIFKLGIFQEDKLIGLSLIIKEVAKRGSFLLCPHGPLIDWNNKEIRELLIDHLKTLAKQEKVAFIRFCPLAPNNPENKKIFKDLGFRDAPIHVHPELSWMLNLSPTEEELLKDMRKNCRYAIKKAIKDGVTVTTSTDPKSIELFESIYGETANRNNFTPFSKNYIRKEFEAFIKNNKTLFIFGKYKDEVISGAMVIYSNGSGFYHHGASTRKHQKISASQLVQWEAIKEAKKRGCKHYNFWGIAPANQPKHPFTGITLFKRGFGGFSEEYVHAQDLVISPKYWLNYLVENFRRIKRGF